VAGLQYMLDRGTTQDWFAANDIRIAAVVGVVGTAGFIFHSLRLGPNALFDLRIFRDRNFTLACAAMAALGLGLFGGLVMQPVLLEGLLGYPIVTTGLVMAPRGIATAVAMIVVGRLVGKGDPRLLVGAGMIVSALGSYYMTYYSLDVNTFWIIWPALLQGLGLGLIFVPLSTIAYATLDRSRMAEAAGIYSLVRTIGAAAGISVVTTILTHEAQVNWNELSAHITRFNPAVLEFLRPLHLDPSDPRAAVLLAAQVGQQAQMIAMLDVFKVTMWSFIAMLPLVFLLKRNRSGAPPPAHAAAME
jgi:DHA2 family multidrug resistance protein